MLGCRMEADVPLSHVAAPWIAGIYSHHDFLQLQRLTHFPVLSAISCALRNVRYPLHPVIYSVKRIRLPTRQSFALESLKDSVYVNIYSGREGGPSLWLDIGVKKVT